MTQLASHKGKSEQSQSCTLIYPFLAFLLLGFRLKERNFFFGTPLHGCQLSYLQVQQAHHLSILASAEGLAGLPGTDMVEAVGLDSGPCIREGLCKESLVIILAEKSSFVAFCSMELFSFQKQCSQTKWLFLLLRFIDPGSCLKQVHPERFGS